MSDETKIRMTTLTSTQRARLAWAGAAVIVVSFCALVICLRGDAAPDTAPSASACP